MLAGDRPAHAEIYYDMDNQRRLLFIFSEICIRLAGKFRLQLTLTRLPSSGLSLPLPSFALASTVTDIITVVERDEFAIGGPTPLMKCLQRQGVSFPVSDNTGAEEARAS
ncbi:hypothetical protein OC842_005482 [Tilletia horrida]|uniref:Velvet domain-containing protein n=1 Tax=Tilletia horrida TaxID=155126 RepID=A0AAN6JIY6_9BASI|nr:hypothetical protein OC842_005482 [Tilletia horrida]